MEYPVQRPRDYSVMIDGLLDPHESAEVLFLWTTQPTSSRKSREDVQIVFPELHDVITLHDNTL